MSEKELSYIVSTQPSFWVAGVNCYDMIVAVAKLVVGQLFDELNAEDELGELGEMEVYPNDVKECVDWLMREAELLPMITIKEIVDDYRERWTAASIGSCARRSYSQ